MKSKHGLLLGVMAAVGLYALASVAQTNTSVKVASAGIASDIGFFIADKKGYFRDEGLDVQLTQMANSPQMIGPLGRGQLDVGAGTVAAGLYNAVSQKIAIRVVADKGSMRKGYGFSGLMVRKDLVDSGRFKTYKDLLDHELIVAAVGVASGTTKEAYLLRNLFGFKFRVIMGYPAGGDVDLAMERGEVDGRANVAWPGLKNRGLKDVQEGRIRILYQMGLARHSELPDVPLVMDFARNERERQILVLNFSVNEVGYAFTAPPDVPGGTLDMLRTAFKRTMVDSRFIDEAKKQQLDVNYTAPERLQAIFDGLYATPPELVAEWLRLTQSTAPDEQARVASLKATLVSVSADGITFDDAGAQREARIDREQTAITIGGAKTGLDALKPGFVCSITYFGDKGTATNIACD